jgi:pimeloyl-ACP methyl ester carboxylesterase
VSIDARQNVVDWSRLALMARAASAAYVRDSVAAEKAFEALGMQYVTMLGNGQCYVTIARWDGRMVWAIRGTQFSSGFSLPQLLDNERVLPVTRPGMPGQAMDGYFTPLAQLYDDVLHKFVEGPIDVVGHSMGGVRALLTAALLPRDLELRITALAAPKGATKEFWDAAYQGRHPPLIVGREMDFAPNHPIGASVLYGYRQPEAILDLSEKPPIFLTDWPVLDESIPDHDDKLYGADCAAIAKDPPVNQPEIGA